MYSYTLYRSYYVSALYISIAQLRILRSLVRGRCSRDTVIVNDPTDASNTSMYSPDTLITESEDSKGDKRARMNDKCNHPHILRRF